MTLSEAVSLAHAFVTPKKCSSPLNRNLKVDPSIEKKWFSLRRKIWLKKGNKLGQKHSQGQVLNEKIDAESIGINERISRVTYALFSNDCYRTTLMTNTMAEHKCFLLLRCEMN